ncbi:DUF86 domain-containing protein [Agrobacterium fabrum]|uniref:HepT-like ribonuclease domain-containing protein n=1 Tax=Agrobacterium fabrum TaxID=1176649 RepID=UPI000DCF8E6F|nr:DUF86 domain-containing protein [Agrobacterium fabrum]UXT57960.1 DUF86 domain-containing protein [Agrobacterium fabrum]
MSVERLNVYLQDIRQVASETIDFVQRNTKDEFLADLVRQRAVAMNLLIIGETTARIMEEFPAFVADFPDIPWVKMRGMRNGIAHGYMSINLETVWDTTQTAIPDLLDKLSLLHNWHAQGE